MTGEQHYSQDIGSHNRCAFVRSTDQKFSAGSCLHYELSIGPVIAVNSMNCLLLCPAMPHLPGDDPAHGYL